MNKSTCNFLINLPIVGDIKVMYDATYASPVNSTLCTFAYSEIIMSDIYYCLKGVEGRVVLWKRCFFYGWQLKV